MISRDAGRKLIFDNVDHRTQVHTMTEQHQNEVEHWVAVMATENRITDEAFSDKKPRDEEIQTMENGKCLPNAVDHKSQNPKLSSPCWKNNDQVYSLLEVLRRCVCGPHSPSVFN